MTALRWINTSHPRLWVVVLPAEYTTEELLGEFASAMDALRHLPPSHRIIVLTDLTAVGDSDSRRRQRIAKFMTDNRVLIGKRVVAWGFVASGIMRGALTALSWTRAFPVPMRVFGERPPCQQWLDEMLAADSGPPAMK
jgi:hypothetical protein